MKVDFKGFDELNKALMKKAYRLEHNAPVVVRRNIGQLAEKMQSQTHVSYNKGYSNNETKHSIVPEFSDGGLTGEVGPHMSYNPYTEYGTRFMEPAPIIEPHRSRQKEQFLKEMGELLDD